LNTGADLATVAAPKKTVELVSSFSPDLISIGLPGDDFSPEGIPKLKPELDKSPAVVVGPGLGTSDDTDQAILDLLNLLVEEYPKVPVLLDADGLKLASKEPELMGELECIVTPHTKEFEYLSDFSLSDDREERIQQVSKVAEDYGITILLKSSVDICVGPEGDIVLNDTGNPGMTVGGTGDVLAGVVGAFISQGSDLFRAGAAGLFLNGLAGDLCEEEKGYQFTASDVKDKIPSAILRAKEYW
jgi:NAD(P)H-hydrate epimerase